MNEANRPNSNVYAQYLNVSGTTQSSAHSSTEGLFTAARTERKLMHVVSQVARVAWWTTECRHAYNNSTVIIRLHFIIIV